MPRWFLKYNSSAQFCAHHIRGYEFLKQSQQLTEKQYMKAWLKLLTTAANKPRQIIKAVDSYFFDEESADIRPFFYGSLGFGIFVTIAIYLIIL